MNFIMFYSQMQTNESHFGSSQCIFFDFEFVKPKQTHKTTTTNATNFHNHMSPRSRQRFFIFPPHHHNFISQHFPFFTNIDIFFHVDFHFGLFPSRSPSNFDFFATIRWFFLNVILFFISFAPPWFSNRTLKMKQNYIPNWKPTFPNRHNLQ